MHNSGSPQKGASAGAPGAGAPHAMKRVLVPNGAPPGLRDDLNVSTTACEEFMTAEDDIKRNQ